MKDRKIEFDGNKFFKILLAGLIVYDVPSIIQAATNKEYSPLVQDIIGAGVGVAIGYMAKDNTLVNASLAIGALDYLNGFIAPEVDKLIAGMKPAVPSGAPVVNITQLKKPAAGTPALSNFVSMPRNGLSEYVDNENAGMISAFQTYRDAYRSN